MKYFLLLCLTFTFSLLTSAAKPSIAPNSVVVLYNSNLESSKELAEYYAKARNIPLDNLIGLNTPKHGRIKRSEYINTIQNPLRQHFNNQSWWSLKRSPDRLIRANFNKIKLIVCMRGIPYGINNDPSVVVPPETKISRAFTKLNCASVDSELATLSIHEYPIYIPQENKYFKKDTTFSNSNLHENMLVGRIDAKNPEDCKRMIDDAIEIEKTGLFGMSYLDKAMKGSGYTLGDTWLDNIERRNWSEGIPTQMENTKDNYLTNYPMKDVALYFGWYAKHRNGPLLNPHFRFKKGAIAVHLHSFSAANIRAHDRHWVGAITHAGAAATLGNVYEPYLETTHHFDIFHDRLLKGYTLVEAASMSMRLLSWQSVVIGDPLYQPYKVYPNGKPKQPTDKTDLFYSAVQIGLKAWSQDEDLLSRKFRTAAQQAKEARYYEIIGLLKQYKGKNQEAALFFSAADKLYLGDADKTRVKLHIIDLLRKQGQKDQALLAARALHQEIEGTAEQATVKSIINILSPPPPPKALPNKQTPGITKPNTKPTSPPVKK